jgi:hypothetical protein
LCFHTSFFSHFEFIHLFLYYHFIQLFLKKR